MITHCTFRQEANTAEETGPSTAATVDLSLAGELDLATGTVLVGQIITILSLVCGPVTLALNLQDVTFIDTAGFRSLEELTRTVRARGGQVDVARSGSSVTRYCQLITEQQLQDNLSEALTTVVFDAANKVDRLDTALASRESFNVATGTLMARHGIDRAEATKVVRAQQQQREGAEPVVVVDEVEPGR